MRSFTALDMRADASCRIGRASAELCRLARMGIRRAAYSRRKCHSFDAVDDTIHDSADAEMPAAWMGGIAPNIESMKCGGLVFWPIDTRCSKIRLYLHGSRMTETKFSLIIAVGSSRGGIGSHDADSTVLAEYAA